MFERLIDIDKSWLLSINGAHAPWADTLMWHISQAGTWLPLYVLLIMVLLLKFRGQRTAKGIRLFSFDIHFPLSVIALVMMAIAVGGADLICAQLIKPLVARPRPTHDAEISVFVHIVNGYRGGAYGFCSNHAANTMACATLFTAIITHGKPAYTHAYVTLPMMLWVAINCYSRMYLGVHYPLDILAGLMVGVLMALLVWYLFRGCLYPTEGCVHHDGEG